MNCKSLDPADYANLAAGVAKAHLSYGWCLGHRIPIAWPHEHRLWEYATAFQAIQDHGNIHSVLDVGAGNSILAPQLARDGCVVKEIDASPSVYTDQRNTIMNRFTGLFTSVKQDFFDLPADETFDCVCSISVMEHIPAERQEEAWKKLAKHVVPGGLIVATVDFNEVKGTWANAEGRETQFDSADVMRVLGWLRDEGFTFHSDLTFNGAHVFDYTFYRIIARKGSGL